MTNISTRRLLSGASAIAIAAALANTPAVAGQTFSGGGTPAIVISANTNFVNVTNATVLANADGFGFIIQTGVTIENAGSGPAVDFEQSLFLGTVVNNGSIVANHDTGWAFASDTIVGDVVNNGFVKGAGSGNGNGLGIVNTTITGSIRNNGSISGSGKSADGVTIDDSIVEGDFVNSGHITGGNAINGNGVSLDSTSVLGAIRNQSGGVISGGEGSLGDADGLRLTAGSFVGHGIFNDGSIAGGTDGLSFDGILIDDASTVAGGIHNGVGGWITGGEGQVAIAILDGSVVSGGITNDGHMSAPGDGDGIFIFNSTLSGGIKNTGSIKSLNAISLDGATISDGIANEGVLDGSQHAILISGGVFGGGITNSATGSIVSSSDSAIRFNKAIFGDGITNHGSIAGGTDADAIVVFSGNFSGGIHNASDGSILAKGTGNGIEITDGTVFSGGLLNEGHITAAAGSGIRVATSTFTGTLDNAGTIISGNNGIYLDVGYIADGIVNSGTIQAPTAINMFLASASQTVTQTDGKILGDVAFSGLGDSFFVGKGGYFKGAMQGSGGNDDVTVVSGTWSAEGSASAMRKIAVTGGTGVFGGRFVGDLAGTGFDVGNNTRTFMTTEGRAFIDDDSTISVSNDATFGAEGTLEFLLTSHTATHGIVSAPVASLDGRLAAYFDWDSFAGASQNATYQGVIVTNNLQGAFDNENDVDTNSIFFTATATQRLDQFVDINAHRVGFDEILLAPSGNQKSIGGALEAIFAHGGAPFLALEDPKGNGLQNPQERNEGLYSALFQLGSAGDVAAAYSSLDGHINAAIFHATFAINDLLDRNIQGRLEDARDAAAGTHYAGDPTRYAAATIIASDAAIAGGVGGRTGWSAWARAFGSWGNADGDAFNEGFDQDSKGFGMGIDFAPNGSTVIGLAGQFANTMIDFDQPTGMARPAHAEVDSWQVALYGNHSFGRLFVDGNASATFNNYDTRRDDFWGQQINSSYSSTVYSAYAEFGADLTSGRLNFQPYAGIGFRHADFDDFTEICPLFCLAVAPDNAESLYSALGVRATATYQLGNTPVTPEVKIAWQHEFGDDHGSFDAAFVGAPGSPFHVEGHTFSDDKVVVGAGLSAEVSRNFALFADYNGSFSSDFEEHSVSAGVRVTW